MARVAGVDLPPHKRAEVGLTYIYGIGRSRASSILNEAGVNLSTRVSDLSEDGCFIESLCAPDKGEQIEVMATLAAQQLRLRGRVIYVVPAVGFGVAFVRSDDTAARTRQVLEEVAS